MVPRRRRSSPARLPTHPTATTSATGTSPTVGATTLPCSAWGPGGNDFPRDQANASLTFFRGKHELKAGIDVQDVTFSTIVSIDTEYRGRGYGRSIPGGYESPVNKRVFDCPSPCETAFTSDLGALYLQDRITVGDRLTVSLGLRQDTQDIYNNLGQSVMDFQKVAPRLSAVYDVNADGRMLVKASAGRYFDYIGLGVVFTEFTAGANGENAYTQYGWNPETQLYDVFQRRVEARDPPGLLRRALLQGRDLDGLRLAVVEQLGLQVARDLVGDGEHVPQHACSSTSRARSFAT